MAVLEGFGGVVGAVSLAVAVASWSLAPSVISRASLRAPIDPLGFNGWRMLVAALFTLPLAVVLEGFPWRVPWLDPVFEAGVWLGGVVASVVGDGLFVFSVSRVGASVALPAAYLFVVWTGLVDYLLGRIGGVAALGVMVGGLLALAGIVVVSLSGGGRGVRDPVGVGAAVATSLVWGGSMYAYQAALSRAGPLSVAEARAVFMVAVLVPWMLRWGRRWLRVVWAETLASGFLGYFLGAVAFLEALRLMPASVVAVGLAATPVLTQLASGRVAGEEVNQRLLAGGLLVAAGIAAAMLSRSIG